jgi:hypothetical protein
LAAVIFVAYRVLASAFRWKAKAMPALSLLFLALTAGMPVNLHKIMQLMWTRHVPGTIGSGACLEVAVIDICVTGLMLLLSILLWVAFAREKALGGLVSGCVLTLGAATLSGVAMYYTVPRQSDVGEGLLFMFIVIPGAILVAAVTVVTCVTILALSARKLSRAEN